METQQEKSNMNDTVSMYHISYDHVKKYLEIQLHVSSVLSSFQVYVPSRTDFKSGTYLLLARHKGEEKRGLTQFKTTTTTNNF